ncbi:polysaccharide pyruvyl transferase family protein [Rahnella inusitata]|uniref:polysaccharide pyruvyl transferase family protein n=1 Tax=Rahnella inusitata TaxID=58169 RepID=UPI0039BE8635
MATKVGIINFQYSDHNYGAVLQAAALENFLKGKCISSEHIDYISTPVIKAGNSTDLVKNIIKRIGLTTILKRLLRKPIIIKHVVNNNAVFENFRNKWIQRTKRFDNYNELINENLNYSAVIVGSDQVWRPTMYTRLTDYKVYFLGFISKPTKKISYAASFGVDMWEINDKKVTEEIKEYVTDFTAISVRENSGVTICIKNFNKVAIHVLDPTLLIGKSFFEEIINEEEIQSSQYNNVVYYKLDIDERFNSNIERLGVTLSKKVVNIYYNRINDSYEYYSVGTWLNNIKTSDLIITDSFHCVCFSILFNKEFICCINESRGLSRLESLFDALGIQNRIVSSAEDLSNKINNIQPIDYAIVNSKLTELRKISENFLLDSLGDI